MPFSLIPLLLLIVPLSEIAVFVLVGREIGVLATLALVFVTAVIGTILLRLQGFSILRRIRTETEAGRLPGRELGDGAMIMAAGILLLTPGFVTDSIGFLLFVPQIRDLIWNAIASRITVVRAPFDAPFDRNDAPQWRREDEEGVIDLERDEFHEKREGSSPWRRGEE